MSKTKRNKSGASESCDVAGGHTGGMGRASVVRRDAVSRSVRDSLRARTAAEAIGTIQRGCEIYGLTGGQFSLVDVIVHALKFTGPADAVVATWTASGSNIDFALGFLADKRLLSLKWIVDFSFPARCPDFCAALLEKFGADAVRVTKNHAKFVLLRNADGWGLVVRTSMNLNENRRLENFEISDCPRLSAYLWGVVDELWQLQAAGDGPARRPWDNCQEFAAWVKADGSALAGSDEAAFFGDGVGAVDLRRVGRTRR